MNSELHGAKFLKSVTWHINIFPEGLTEYLISAPPVLYSTTTRVFILSKNGVFI
jgi:hypothetical protein